MTTAATRAVPPRPVGRDRLRIAEEILPAQLAAYLALEAKAAAPYSRFVYDDETQAQALRALLFERGLSEFAPGFGRALLEGDRLLGMMACLPAHDLHERRRRAAVALARSGALRRHPSLRRRLGLAGRTLLQVRPGELYLSRIAVGAAHWGHGLAHVLMDRLEQEAREQALPGGGARGGALPRGGPVAVPGAAVRGGRPPRGQRRGERPEAGLPPSAHVADAVAVRGGGGGAEPPPCPSRPARYL
jgi:GNAT superfamily N-acetyltransferase